MFGLPEVVTLARQINETLTGKIIRTGSLGNSPHKFVWYNRSHEEFAKLTKGKTIGEARAKGEWLFIPLEPGYVLLFGEFGGKLLYHPAGAKMPKKYHLYITFEKKRCQVKFPTRLPGPISPGSPVPCPHYFFV